MLFTIIKDRYVTVDVTFFEDSPYYPPHSDELQNNSHTLPFPVVLPEIQVSNQDHTFSKPPIV